MVGKLGNHLSDLAKTSLSPSEGSLGGGGGDLAGLGVLLQELNLVVQVSQEALEQHSQTIVSTTAADSWEMSPEATFQSFSTWVAQL